MVGNLPNLLDRNITSSDNSRCKPRLIYTCRAQDNSAIKLGYQTRLSRQIKRPRPWNLTSTNRSATRAKVIPVCVVRACKKQLLKAVKAVKTMQTPHFNRTSGVPVGSDHVIGHRPANNLAITTASESKAILHPSCDIGSSLSESYIDKLPPVVAMNLYFTKFWHWAINMSIFNEVIITQY